MADWVQQFSSALDARDVREKAHKPYIEAYTRLADRTFTSSATPPSSSSAAATSSTPHPSTRQQHQQQNQQALHTSTLTSLRAELASTQRIRTTQTAELTSLRAELSTVREANALAQKTLSTQDRARKQLERKLRDRDEELAGKRAIVSDVQDEMVALNLQLNVAEAKNEELRKENEELVRRWMERMGMEAERVNRDSNWGV